jgi:hypothetical protein
MIDEKIRQGLAGVRTGRDIIIHVLLSTTVIVADVVITSTYVGVL